MTAGEWVVWGTHPRYAGGVPILLTSGSLPHCRAEVRFRRLDREWSLVIRKPGVPHRLESRAA